MELYANTIFVSVAYKGGFNMRRRRKPPRKTYTNSDGYQVYKDSNVPVHIRVAEGMLGGPIYPGRVVHHKDGNKRNNNPNNLWVMSRSNHSKLHSRKRKQGQ